MGMLVPSTGLLLAPLIKSQHTNVQHTQDLSVHTMLFFTKEPLEGPCHRDMKSGKAGALSASSLPFLEPIACFA